MCVSSESRGEKDISSRNLVIGELHTRFASAVARATRTLFIVSLALAKFERVVRKEGKGRDEGNV